ncbi:CHAT domain-containing protein [Rhodocollybia butyracea]|uniref:CHAT domain-containing protein n=1 Tax=Rhodocollybia butyracea TaxID=206335 RepID=A0A9P5PI84_9AGAR|nr:CHAT domain-containing protein [Rhodocollybia butyracea]
MDHRSGILKATEDNITRTRAALLLHPIGHPDRGSLVNNLSLGLSDRFEQTGHLEDLNESIQLNRDVLLLRPMGHPDRGSSIHNLSLGLFNRFHQTGHFVDLDESIHLSRDALLLHPMGHQDRGSSIHNLSLGLINRFQQTGHLEDLDESIQLNRDALLIRPMGHPDRNSSLNNLILSLSDRFNRTGHLENLDESIQLNRDAILLHPIGHPARGTLIHNLSLGLSNRFNQTGHLEDLDESIQLSRDVLLLIPGATQTMVLHSTTSMRFCSVPWATQTMILHSTTLVWASGTALSRQAIWKTLRKMHFYSIPWATETMVPHSTASMHFYSVPWATQTVVLHSTTSVWASGIASSRQSAYQRPNRQLRIFYSPVSDCLKAVKNWVIFTQLHPDLAQSNLDAHIMGLSIISRYLSMMPIISLQYQHLSSVIKLPEFVSDGASQAIHLGQLTLAVEIIEQGRGLLWSELRGLRTPMDRLRVLDPSLVDELMQIHHQLEILSMQNSADRGIPLVKLLRRYRKFLDLRPFLGRKSFDELKSAAKHGPIIVVNCNRYRSDILIVLDQNSPVLISLVEGLYEQVETLMEQLTEARFLIKASPKRYNHVLRATLKDLWELVVSPVVTKLQELQIPKMSRIFWCPTSILSMLPLHAAGPISPGTKEFLPDLYISSYTPTLTALIDAFNTNKSSLQLPHLLVAGQYDKSLPRTKEEINQVLQYQTHIPITSVEGSAATKEVLEKALVDHEWLHIASHGTLVPGKPFSSYFSLAGGSHFTLLDIIRLNLPNATFAFLSACHTAEQSPDSVHNEVIHLAAAMQFSGFRGVVGTMWEMADIDGPDMVKDFYSHLFSDENLSRCNEVGAQARALSEAIKKMRGRKGVTLERWVNFVHIGA